MLFRYTVFFNNFFLIVKKLKNVAVLIKTRRMKNGNEKFGFVNGVVSVIIL